MPLTDMKTGFIGLGLMGTPMAANLLAANADLIVQNRTVAKCTGLVEAGARLAITPKEVAEYVGKGTIVICLSDTPALHSALCGEQGVLAGITPGATVIDMGTSEVSTTRVLASAVAAAGGHYVDAPVSGGEVGAKRGTLSIMAGGDAWVIDEAKSLFNVLGSALTHIGPVGTGQAAKAANQIIVGATVGIVAEALALAVAAGANIERVRAALMGGFADSRIMDLHGQRMIDGDFVAGARARTQLKDMRQAIRLADEVGLVLPLASRSHALWDEMVAEGLGDLDQSGYFVFVNTSQKSAD